MKFGRAGIVFAGHRGKFNKFDIENHKLKNPDLFKYQEKCKSSSKEILEFNQVPLAVWFAGCFIVMIGIYMFYHVGSGGDKNKIFKGFSEGFWWQYFVSAFIVFLGCSFIFAVKREQIEFNKDKNKITIMKKNICCFSDITTRKLSNLLHIGIIKRGHDSVANKTIHYVIELTFMDERKIEILETNSQTKTKRRYIAMKVFLNEEIDIDNIPIIDESTSNRI